MGTAILIFILLSILLYLIVAASDETRTINAKKEKKNWGLTYLAKANLSLTAKFFKQRAEIERLKEINADLRSEHEEYIIFKNNMLDFTKQIMSDIHDIKVTNDWNILEYDKKQRINEQTKTITIKCTKFIDKNELDALKQHLIQK